MTEQERSDAINEQRVIASNTTSEEKMKEAEKKIEELSKPQSEKK